MHTYSTLSLVVSAVLSLAACDGQHVIGAGGAGGGAGGDLVTSSTGNASGGADAGVDHCQTDSDCPQGAIPSEPCRIYRCNVDKPIKTPGAPDGCYIDKVNEGTTCGDGGVCDSQGLCGATQCDDGNDCTQDVFWNGACEHFNYTNLSTCGPLGAGHCNSNVIPAECCMGCLLNGMCISSCPAGMNCSGDGVCLG